jgi:AcrR family transcriptional regulator
MTRWKPDAAGRLVKAAIMLFDQQGYDETTVAEIAESAGLTKRTFFRYFTDKREVLFQGSEELEHLWVDGLAAAPPDAGALAAVMAGLEPVTAMFAERHPFAQIRTRIIAANPELQERELIKLQTLAAAIAASLRARGVSDDDAVMAAQTGVTVFRVAFARWVAQDDPGAFQRLTLESLDQLKSVTSA